MALGTLVAAAVAVAAGCSGPASAPEQAAPEVTVAMPEVAEVTVYNDFNGTLSSVASVEIRARVEGYLEQVTFADSSDVEAGQLLFVIERHPYEVAVARAEADLARARAGLELAKARQARVERAFERKAVSEIERIEARSETDRSRADVAAMEAVLDNARLNLDYTEVRSPLAGRVDEAYVDAGNLVGGGEDTLLATVVQMDPIQAYFDVSESIALAHFARGDDGTIDGDAPVALLGLSNEKGWPHRGRVDYVDNVVDPDTGTIRMRAVFDNKDGRLYPGLFARIRVPFEQRKDAVLVAEDALVTDLNGKYVLVVGEDDVVERRAVVLGGRYDGRREVVSGLESNQRYIVAGLQRARPGMPVNPVTAAAAAAAAAASAAAGEGEGEAASPAAGDEH